MTVRGVVTVSLVWLACGSSDDAFAQDSRRVQEPQFPKVCKVLVAPLGFSNEHPVLRPNVSEDQESAREAQALQDALNWCAKSAPGSAVRLSLGKDESLSAFLINPITIPASTSLIVDGGVTVVGSRNAANYQTSLTQYTCGMSGSGWPVYGGCSPLVTLNSGTGIYGYGVIDGQGGQVITGVQNPANQGGSWWDLTTTRQNNQQAAPPVFATATNQTNDVTLYEVTVRNPPYHTIRLTGSSITVWGVKVQAPWDIPNTDGFDIAGQDVTIFDATVANGDQEVAISAAEGETSNVTIERFKGYNKGGIAMLGNGGGSIPRPLKNVLVRDALITGEIPSFFIASFKGKSEAFVNGVPESLILKRYGAKNVTSYLQALPNATDVHGLQITLNTSGIASENGPVVENIRFESVCMRDIGEPINIAPEQQSSQAPGQGFTPPVVKDVTFKDVHVLAPSNQYVSETNGKLSAGGGYNLSLIAYPHNKDTTGFRNHLTFNNVVFDDASVSNSSIASIVAEGNRFITRSNVYPVVLNGLSAPYRASSTTSADTNPSLTLNDNGYVETTPTSNPSLAYSCSQEQPPFVTGELYLSGEDGITDLSANWKSATITEGSSVTLNAVVQPIMSQSTYLNAREGSTNPLLAIGAPKLTNPVIFYEQGKPVGFGRLSANGTLARAVIANVRPGLHTYTAQYPRDLFYKRLDFGSVTLKVSSVPIGDHSGKRNGGQAQPILPQQSPFDVRD